MCQEEMTEDMGVCRRAVTAENMRRYLEIFRNTFILLGYLRYSVNMMRI